MFESKIRFWIQIQLLTKQNLGYKLSFFFFLFKARKRQKIKYPIASYRDGCRYKQRVATSPTPPVNPLVNPAAADCALRVWPYYHKKSCVWPFSAEPYSRVLIAHYLKQTFEILPSLNLLFFSVSFFLCLFGPSPSFFSRNAFSWTTQLQTCDMATSQQLPPGLTCAMQTKEEALSLTAGLVYSHFCIWATSPTKCQLETTGLLSLNSSPLLLLLLPTPVKIRRGQP